MINGQVPFKGAELFEENHLGWERSSNSIFCNKSLFRSVSEGGNVSSLFKGISARSSTSRWHPFVSTFIILFSSLACLRGLLAIEYLLESIPSLLKLWNGSSFNLCNIIVESVKALNPQNRNKKCYFKAYLLWISCRVRGQNTLFVSPCRL